MADEGISTKVSVLGDKEYKQAMQDIGRGLTLLKTEMAATASSFGDQADSMEALQAKGQGLEKLYKAQAEKVRLVAEQLAKAKGEYGENSKQADDLQIALNRAQKALNETETEIGRNKAAMEKLADATEDTGDAQTQTAKDSDKLNKALDETETAAKDAKKETSGLKDALTAAGEAARTGLVIGAKAAAAAFAAVSAAAGAAATAAFSFAQGAGTYADDLLTLSTQTGVSTQTLQAWRYAANFIDVDVGTITDSMARMIRTMGQASSGNEAATQKFAALGVAIRGADGTLRDSGSVFADCITALGTIQNETERDALAMELFGKSAQDLNPLIEAGTDALADMGLEAAAMGTVFSDDALNAMGSFDDSMQRVNATGEALKNSIGLMMIPAFQPLMDTASSTMAEVAKALQDGVQPGELETLLSGTLTQVEAAMGDVTALIDGALPVATAALGTLVSTLAEKLPGLVDTLTPAALSLLQSVLDSVSGNTEKLSGVATSVITQVATFLTQNASGLLGAATDLVLELVTGIGNALPDLLPAAASMVSEIATGIATNLPDVLTAGANLLAELVSGIAGALPTLAAEAPKLIAELTGGIVKALPDVLAAGGQIFAELLKGIFNAAIDIATQLQSVTDSLTKAFEDTDMATVGQAIWDGLVGGIRTALEAGMAYLKEIFQKVIGAVKDVFGIASPSKEMETVGDFILKGLIEGFQSAIEGVLTTVKAIFGRIWDAIKSIFGFGSGNEESKEAKDAGKDIMSGMKDGITGSEDDVKRAVKDASRAVLDTFKSELGVERGNSTKTKAMGTSVAKGIDDGLRAATQQTFAGGAKALFDAVCAAMNSAFGVEGTGFLGMGEASAKKLEALGAAACKAIADGIAGNTQNTEAVKTAMTGIANAAYEAAVAEMATGITGGSGTVNAAVAAVAADAREAAASLLSADTGGQIGKDFMEGARRGVQSARAALIAAVRRTAQSAHDAAARVLSEANGQRIGTALAQGVGTGITSQQGQVSGAAQSLGSGALSALWGAVGSGGSRFEAIGHAIAQGVARGIRSGSDTIVSAARAAAQAAYDAAKRELDIHSPSRKMQTIGMQFDQGFAGGIEKGMDSVLRSARQLSAMAAAETAAGGRGAATIAAQEGIDYERLGEAVAAANRRAGLGHTRLIVGKRALGETLEPDVSRAITNRAAKTAAGRTARMVLA